MKMKKTLLHVTTVASLVVASSIQRKKKAQKKPTKSHDRISIMIILNGINFLLLRFPLAVLSFYGFVFRYNREIGKYVPDLIS